MSPSVAGLVKKGSIKKPGAGAIQAPPLFGHSGDLRREFDVQATQNSVTVGNSAEYAAMQQFGGTKASFPHLWGDIPVRPFLPILQNGDLYPAERSAVVEAIHTYLSGK